MKRLLAKSVPDPRAPRADALLPCHAAQVLQAAEEMLSAQAVTALDRADLTGEREMHWFCTLVRFGAFLHDWGKANEHFQAMLRGTQKAQLVRHEALSALLALSHPPLSSWLSAAPAFRGAENAWLVEGSALAAAGHHLKFDAHTLPRGDRRGPVSLSGAGQEVKLLLAHSDFAGTLSLGKKLGLPDPPSLVDQTWRSANPLDDPDEHIQGPLFDPQRGLLSLNGRGARWWRGLDERRRKLFALAKAWVVAADVAGSALGRDGVSVQAWLGPALAAVPEAENLERVVGERLKGNSLRPFQRAIAASTRAVTLVEAGCGTGKTAAAYAWAAQQTRIGRGGKLFFAYPTTGTATEGFRGYVADPDTIEARLVHSRSAVDIDELLSTREIAGAEEQVRSESLMNLRSQVIVCTADTVLGLMQSHRRGLFLSPAISTGSFVFDEIHAYDDRMFAALLDFLRTFPKAPVLLMSASVPVGRRRAIEGVVGPLPEMPRPDDVERIPRYEIGPIVSREEVWTEIERCLSGGGKVLWVSNSVNRAVDAGHIATKRGLDVRCYHSRFRYEDRVKRHREVIAAFEPTHPAALVVTTQVAEMSLDLSANLLVTDIAPVPSLVQRLGRLNRRASPDAPGTPQRALAIVPGSVLPYEEDDLRLGEAFWRAAQARGGALDQRDVNELMHATLGAQSWPPPGETARASVWLESGPASFQGELRDADATVTVLLEQDVPRIESLAARDKRAARDDLLRCAVPIRAEPAVWSWPRRAIAPFHPVAPAEEVLYDQFWGARRAPKHERGGDDHG